LSLGGRVSEAVLSLLGGGGGRWSLGAVLVLFEARGELSAAWPPLGVRFGKLHCFAAFGCGGSGTDEAKGLEPDSLYQKQ
jgi:hypothetical protein